MSSSEQLAEQFTRLFYEREWPSGEEPALEGVSLAQAYDVQERVMAHRLARGERVVGYKVGCTSAAIQKQFGLSEPIFGRLYHPHTFEVLRTDEKPVIDWCHYARCAIEPEIVLRLGKDLCGQDLSDETLIDAIESVSPGIELHHFTFWKQPPTTQELICTGGIHAGLVIGNERVSPRSLTFRNEVFSVVRNGHEVTAGAASEIMGGPLRSLRWLVNTLTRRGLKLHAGEFVIPGSPVELVVIDDDCDLTVSIQRTGEIAVSFRET